MLNFRIHSQTSPNFNLESNFSEEVFFSRHVQAYNQLDFPGLCRSWCAEFVSSFNRAKKKKKNRARTFLHEQGVLAVHLPACVRNERPLAQLPLLLIRRFEAVR